MRIGIDLGGTKTEVIVLDDCAQTVLRRRVPTPANDYAGIVAAIVRLIEIAREAAGREASIGIGVPGTISRKTGRMINANSTVLIGKPLREDLQRAIGTPVRMANDANCLALSESIDGAAREASVVFGVILGTGVGGGIAVDRRIIGGTNGIAGEWGHNPLPWPTDDERPGPACYCGKHGCIETFLCGPALARQREAAGHAHIEDVLQRYEDRLARALAGVINILDPDVVVFGGGVSNMSRIYPNLPPLLANYVFSDALRTRLVPAAHGDSSGVRGAAMLWEERGTHEF